jgi:2-polyprenyl-6-methoxyphenol hydroxylase-like FAD-dependent oxidoreductase
MASQASAAADRSHALVIGGSIAGLLAARVLADHFERVTILDRDHFPAAPEFRKGVPQSRHAHILLVRGWQILDQLFPGLRADLAAAGAPAIDVLADFKMLTFSGWAPRTHSRLITVSCSRDLLEWHIRRQLAANSRVRFCEGREAAELIADPASGRILGVRARNRDAAAAGADESEEFRAGLVVDASGRSSRAPQWLAGLGYGTVEETLINSFLGYASRFYRRPAGFNGDWQGVLISARPPNNPRGGTIVPLEDNRWLVTLGGAGRDYPPTEEAGFLAFAQSLASPLIYEAIRDAEPLSAIHGYQRTENRWRHYERMGQWPQGFMITGDAVCAFNPVYGQGMTAAAVGAVTLDGVLRKRGRREAERRFQRELARRSGETWLMATGEDFRYPTTEGGQRTAIMRWTHWYMDRVIAASAHDIEVLTAFATTAHLLAPPASLFHPRIVARALRPHPQR